MPLLALNTVLPQTLRAKYQVAIAALPIGLMVGCVGAMAAGVTWLERAGALPLDGALRDQPGGLWWILGALFGMVAFMLLGYVSGWLLNALISRRLLGWSPEQVRAVYLRSEVPAHWLKPGADGADARSIANWETHRQAGPWRFIAVRGLLAWGAPMFAAMYLLPAWLKGQPITPEGMLGYGAIWASGGLMFGAVMWFAGQANYRKLVARREA
jgi:hypothetical protein